MLPLAAAAAVVFAWGVDEDGQLGLETQGQNVVSPKVRRRWAAGFAVLLVLLCC